MKFNATAFNIYLCILALGLAAGCKTSTPEEDEKDPKKQTTALRLHIESMPDRLGRTTEVPVFRARPVMITILKDAFITENQVISADLIDDQGGGYSVEVKFEREGKWLLDSYTGANKGRHIAIFADFGPGKQRWVAAPVITQVITNGTLRFTPDADRAETDRIVRGLNNVARKNDHDPRF